MELRAAGGLCADGWGSGAPSTSASKGLGASSQGQQDLVFVGSLNNWSLAAARKSQVFKKRSLPSGAWDHALEVQLDQTGLLEFQVLSKESGFDWCLYPSRWDKQDATLVQDTKYRDVALSVLRGDADGKNFRISEPICTLVIHVLAEARDFAVWYEKLPLTLADRLATMPSWHPYLQAPGPSARGGAGTLRPEKLARGEEAKRHMAASGDFASLLLQMRDESPGGMEYLEGLRRLFQDDMHQMASAKSLQTVADHELLDFGNFLEKAETNLKSAQRIACEDKEEYGRLFYSIEQEVAAFRDCTVETDAEASSNWMLEFTPKLTLGLIFVHLPMVMYVHNSEHLYEMLARMNCEAARGTSPEDGGAGDGRGRLRRALDAGGRPYSWLVFAVVAALQVLFRVRAGFLEDRDFPFIALLASNPPEIDRGPGCGEMPSAKTALPGKTVPKIAKPLPPPPSRDSLEADAEKRREEERAKQRSRWSSVYRSDIMYRGLWVPPALDEDRVRHPYSFNSFSRSLDGTLSVLEFYGKVLPLARPPDWHVLLLIASGWTTSAWVVPVQFWAGNLMGQDEQELIVPPFMSFTLEQVELNSGMSEAELEQNAATVVRQWYGDERLKQGASALELLGGPSLPRLLARDLELFERMGPAMGAAWREASVGPFVTVRFIARMFPRPAVRALFSNESQLLLAFPPVG